jgi:hypothetical protein
VLAYVDCVMRIRGLKNLRNLVCEADLISAERATKVSIAEICNTIDLASIFYFKRVMCLQRAAATTLLLRRYGWPAEMVIASQIFPFESHAWVEIDKAVINDKPYVKEIYKELDRW